jgi:hypothetical protein
VAGVVRIALQAQSSDVTADHSMRSLRSRLSALWLMLAMSGAATAYLLLESFQQSSEARVARAEDLVVRSCRDIASMSQSADSRERRERIEWSAVTSDD